MSNQPSRQPLPSGQLPAEYYSALEELQALDFALVELQLYLDTHPADKEALSQLQDLSFKRAELVIPFEKAYGPLLHYGRSPLNQPTEWTSSPWPWEI